MSRRSSPTIRSAPRSKRGSTACAIRASLERQESGKEGRFTGKYAINPFTNEEIPIWLGNFVLMQYGTGAIMAVPAHDQRDFEFAKQYGLVIRPVIRLGGGQAPPPVQEEAFTAKDDSAVLINSGAFDGLTPPKAIEKIIEEIERRGIGKKMVRYRLRDWLISRQRYWGTPIPMIYCDRRRPRAGAGERSSGRAAAGRAVHGQGREPARKARGVREREVSAVRTSRTPRDRHDGHVRRLVLVLRAFHLAARRDEDLRLEARRIAGSPSISTSAASSTRSFICSTPVSSARTPFTTSD